MKAVPSRSVSPAENLHSSLVAEAHGRTDKLDSPSLACSCCLLRERGNRGDKWSTGKGILRLCLLRSPKAATSIQIGLTLLY